MKQILLIITLIVIARLGFSQTNYLWDKTSVNPSSMAELAALQANISVHHSLQGFDRSPKSIFFSAASPLRSGDYYERASIFGGFGSYEQVGIHHRYRAYVAYAYRFQLNEEMALGLSLATGVAIDQTRYRDLEASEDDPFIGTLPIEAKIDFVYKFGAELIGRFYSVSLYASQLEQFGIGVGFFTPRDEDDLIMELALHGRFQPNSTYARIQAGVYGMITYKGVGFGLSYESPKDLAANVMIRLYRQVRIGYSYKIMSLMFQSPQHEISVRYNLPVRIDDTRRYFKK